MMSALADLAFSLVVDLAGPSSLGLSPCRGERQRPLFIRRRACQRKIYASATREAAHLQLTTI